MKKANITPKRIKTCLWIATTISEHGGLSLEEFNELWIRDSLSDGKPMERRTFYNYLLAVNDLLKVYIECDRHDHYRYKVDANFGEEKTAKWIDQAMSVAESVSSHFELKDRILVEDIPGGLEWLNPIMDAMRSLNKVTFSYRSYDDPTKRIIEEADPYCLKMYQQRWYLLVKEFRTLLVSHKKIEEMHVYALDRILNLQIVKKPFKLDKYFDAESYFHNVVGTQVYKDIPTEVVRLKANASVASYLRSLPWHPTMKEVERNTEYSIFELNVALTVDLYQKIAMFGSRIEVLEPKDLKDVIRVETFKLAELYGIVEPATKEEIDAQIEILKQEHPELLDDLLCRDAYAGFAN